MPIYLEIKGIPGDSLASGYEGWIEVESFSTGAENPPGTGSGLEFSPHVISVSKSLDGATAPCMQALANATSLSLKIDLTQPDDSGKLEVYARYIVTGAAIIKFETSADGDGRPSEDIEFSWQRIDFEYDPMGKLKKATWLAKSK